MLTCSHALRTHEVCKTHPSDEPCLNALVAALMPRLPCVLGFCFARCVLRCLGTYASPAAGFGGFVLALSFAGCYVPVHTIVPHGYLRLYFTVLFY